MLNCRMERSWGKSKRGGNSFPLTSTARVDISTLPNLLQWWNQRWRPRYGEHNSLLRQSRGSSWVPIVPHALSLFPLPSLPATQRGFCAGESEHKQGKQAAFASKKYASNTGYRISLIQALESVDETLYGVTIPVRFLGETFVKGFILGFFYKLLLGCLWQSAIEKWRPSSAKEKAMGDGSNYVSSPTKGAPFHLLGEGGSFQNRLIPKTNILARWY